MMRETLSSTIPSRNDLVHPTKSDTASASMLSELEEREEITEDVPAPADIPAPVPTPVPAPAPTLETVKKQPYTPGSRKSMRKNLGGQPVHLVTFTCNRLKTLSQPGSVDNQYKVELSNVYKSRRH